MRIKWARFSEYIKSSVRSFDEDGHANSKESARTATSIRKWNFPGYQSRIHAVETIWPITNPYSVHVFLSCKSRCPLAAYWFSEIAIETRLFHTSPEFRIFRKRYYLGPIVYSIFLGQLNLENISKTLFFFKCTLREKSKSICELIFNINTSIRHLNKLIKT